MKRNSLTTALLAGLAGAAGLATTATAVNLNPDGLGQVLIYPYYTVNDGNQTLVSVVNTTNRVKAVKVRFLEGRNSKEVLDFNLYLSPFDVWAASVYSTGTTGPANLVTNDTSCTVPRNVNVPFRNYQYTGSNQDFPAEDAAVLGSLDRTREGHVEMIEMGLLVTGTSTTQLAEEATHVNNVPVNCNALVAAWAQIPVPGPWTLNGRQNIELPAGGLFGAGAIIDVANGTMLGYNAEAIEGFYSDSADPGRLHAQPGSVDPDLRDADNTNGGTRDATVFVFSQNGAAVITETFTSTLRPNVPNAVSLVFMHDAIYNDYNTEAGIGGASEWVITFPTKRYYVDFSTPAAVIPPFTDPFRDDGSSCDVITIEYYNREEATPGTAPGVVDVSPPPPNPTITLPSLCWEANILTFNQSQVASGAGASTVLGGRYATNLNTSTVAATTFANGWAKITFDNPTNGASNANVLTADDGSEYYGLPTVGFWAASFVNSAAQPGLLANYSAAFRHRASRNNSG
jgi:hypothetical protein